MIYESHLLCGVGEYQRAAEVARQGIADAERNGLARTSGAFLAINVAEPLLYLGRWDEARTSPNGRWISPRHPAPGAASHLERLARARPRRPRHRRQANGSQPGDGVRRQVRRPENLPQAGLDIGLALATEGPAAAVEVATEALQRATCRAAAPGTSGRCWWSRPRWPGRCAVRPPTHCWASCGPWSRSKTCSARCSAPGSCRTRRSIRAPTMTPPASVARRSAGRGRRRRRRLGGHRPALPGRPRAGRRRSGRALRRPVGPRGGRRPVAPRRADRGGLGARPLSEQITALLPRAAGSAAGPPP